MTSLELLSIQMSKINSVNPLTLHEASSRFGSVRLIRQDTFITMKTRFSVDTNWCFFHGGRGLMVSRFRIATTPDVPGLLKAVVGGRIANGHTFCHTMGRQREVMVEAG